MTRLNFTAQTRRKKHSFEGKYFQPDLGIINFQLDTKVDIHSFIMNNLLTSVETTKLLPWEEILIASVKHLPTDGRRELKYLREWGVKQQIEKCNEIRL